MSTVLMHDVFSNTVLNPCKEQPSESCSSVKTWGKKAYQAAAVAFSGIGNWPFYGVAAAFGNQYSTLLGKVLGGSEFASYFAFRLSNFEDIRQKIFGDRPRAPRIEENGRTSGSNSQTREEEKKLLAPEPTVSVQSSESPRRIYCLNWKTIAKNTAIAALGIIAQFPIMVLTYYGNGENLTYPVICGACEASFTILSLLLTFQRTPQTGDHLHNNQEGLHQRNNLIAQIDCFLEELPSKYNDPAFAQQIDDIFSANSTKSDEQKGKALLHLIGAATGLPPIQKGLCDGVFRNLAKGVGLLIAGYLTAVNGVVSYQGVKAWRDDLDILAVSTTILVSLANIKLLTKLCMDSAESYYEGIRDLLKGQYRPPLAYSVSRIGWGVGRLVSTAGSWLSFGTTAAGARDYVPKAGNAFIAPAPLSSALLLNQNLNLSADHFLLSLASKWNRKTRQFTHLHQSMSEFKEAVASAPPTALTPIFDQTVVLSQRVNLPLNDSTPLIPTV